MEVWKDIFGYEGLYQISNYGNVKSMRRFNRMSKQDEKVGYFREEKLLKKVKRRLGYLQVSLAKNGNTKNVMIHRLVAEAFIPNPNNFYCINHKDENPSNNNVENLEWCTIQYNNAYGARNKRVSQKLKKPINQYDLNGRFIKQWSSATDASKELGVPRAHIGSCISGKRKTTGGFIWKKVEKKQ